jgi:hypothetical protein
MYKKKTTEVALLKGMVFKLHPLRAEAYPRDQHFGLIVDFSSFARTAPAFLYLDPIRKVSFFKNHFIWVVLRDVLCYNST